MYLNDGDPSTWRRVFPRAQWKQKEAIQLLILSIIAGLLLVIMLLLGFLLVDLFVNRGTVTLNRDELVRAQEIFGPSLNVVSRTDEMNASEEITLQNRGLLHSLWYFQDRYWVTPVTAAFKNVSLLRDNSSALVTLLILGVIIGMIRGMILVRCRLLAARMGITSANHLRRSLRRQVMRVGPGDLLNEQTTQAYGLFRNETSELRDAVTAHVYRLLVHPVTIVVLFVVGISISPRLFLQMAVPLLGCWVLVEREKTRLRKSRRLVEAEAELRSNVLAESLRKTRLIRGYSMEDFDNHTFDHLLGQLSTIATAVQRREVISRWLCWGLVLGCLVILGVLAGVKVLLPWEHPQSLQLAEVTLLATVFALSYKPLGRIYDLAGIQGETSLSADRIYRYLSKVPTVGQAVGAKFLDPLTKSISFENVTYSLPGAAGKKLLDQLEVKLPAGEVLVIASAQSLEARSMLYLLPRFLEPKEGRVLIDGEDIAWVTLESLRAETLLVGGTDSYFTGTVLENITCGDDKYTQTEAVAASKKVHAHNFIQKLPQGYQTMLGQHGEQLSPGEAYRLGLARAMLRNPALLLLEEPDDDLSDEDKEMIDDAYEQVFPGRTVVIVPSRMSTIRRSDRIVLLYQGKVATVNTHSNLLAGNELYRHWEYTRFNIFRKLDT